MAETKTNPKVNDQTVAIINAIKWPSVVLLGLLLFYSSVSGVIQHTQSAELTKDGFKAAFYAGAAQAAAAGQVQPPLSIDSNTISLATEKSQSLRDKKILWLDPHPDNNIYQRQAFNALGIQIDVAISTQEAFELEKTYYNVMISNYTRPGDPGSGYGILTALKTLPHPPPVIIYSASAQNRETQSKELIARKELIGDTNSPTELFTLVLKTLLQA